MINESRIKRKQEERSKWSYSYDSSDYGSYYYLIFKQTTGNPNDEICLGNFNMAGLIYKGDILSDKEMRYEVVKTEYDNPWYILRDKTNVIWVV